MNSMGYIISMMVFKSSEKCTRKVLQEFVGIIEVPSSSHNQTLPNGFFGD